MSRLLIALGWVLSKLPVSFMKAMSWSFGTLFFTIPSKRRHLIFSNIHHAFPDQSEEWLRDKVWKNCQATAEMGLLTVVCPHFSKERFVGCVSLAKEAEQLLEELKSEDRPIVLFGYHHSMIEIYNALPGATDVDFPKTTIMYRPYKDKRIDLMIKNHRERCGFKLVSRKEGIRQMGENLRNNGFGSILFDQNTRDSGSLIPFFGRVTSATELPALLAKKYEANPIIVTFRKLGFWRAEIGFERLEAPLDTAALTLAANKWLEDRMKVDEELLVNWLWSHNRWKVLFRPFERLGMKHKKKIIDFSEYAERKTRFAILHSNLHEHDATAVQFLKALRKSRPDAELAIITRDAEAFKCVHSSCVDRFWELPADQMGRKALALEISKTYPDLIMVLDDDEDLRLFAKETKTPQRFGVLTKSTKDKTITDAWSPENPEAWSDNPEWLTFGQTFGLERD